MAVVSIYQVDAFAEALFGGNPAAVCLSGEPLTDQLCQSIAAENNLSETAFICNRQGQWQIRWFTPTSEVELCGHATLAAGFILLAVERVAQRKITFESRSGPLQVERRGEVYWLDFPAWPPQLAVDDPFLLPALGVTEKDLVAPPMLHNDYLLVVKSRAAVEGIDPDFRALRKAHGRGVIVSAADDEVDFVSRFFAPKVGVDEDPVTGSAHCLLIPYWAEALGKMEMTARQLSKRGGQLQCRLVNGAYGDDRVAIGGRAQLFFSGTLSL